jgi:hypothetical protein
MTDAHLVVKLRVVGVVKVRIRIFPECLRITQHSSRIVPVSIAQASPCVFKSGFVRPEFTPDNLNILLTDTVIMNNDIRAGKIIILFILIKPLI